MTSADATPPSAAGTRLRRAAVPHARFGLL